MAIARTEGRERQAGTAETAASPFQFRTETGVVLWTGYTADSLATLGRALRQVTGSSIYYHVHHALFRRLKYTWAEYTNDFARWVATALNQKALAEKLSSVDPMEWSTIRDVRERLIAYIQLYAAEDESFPRVAKEEEFYFLEARSFVVPTGLRATTVPELADGLERLGTGCLLYHFIESRFRNGKGTNDFSRWLRHRGEHQKAEALECLNPYYYDVESLKDQVVDVLRS